MPFSMSLTVHHDFLTSTKPLSSRKAWILLLITLNFTIKALIILGLFSLSFSILDNWLFTSCEGFFYLYGFFFFGKIFFLDPFFFLNLYLIAWIMYILGPKNWLHVVQFIYLCIFCFILVIIAFNIGTFAIFWFLVIGFGDIYFILDRH